MNTPDRGASMNYEHWHPLTSANTLTGITFIRAQFDRGSVGAIDELIPTPGERRKIEA